jgi:hypothetical protein
VIGRRPQVQPKRVACFAQGVSREAAGRSNATIRPTPCARALDSTAHAGLRLRPIRGHVLQRCRDAHGVRHRKSRSRRSKRRRLFPQLRYRHARRVGKGHRGYGRSEGCVPVSRGCAHQVSGVPRKTQKLSCAFHLSQDRPRGIHGSSRRRRAPVFAMRRALGCL